MPKRNGERIGRFANIESATFICPHCKGYRVAHEDELDAESVSILCRHCHRSFVPLAFVKDRLLCDACRRRLEVVNYREAHRMLQLCKGCAAAFDQALADLARARDTILRCFCQEQRGRLKRLVQQGQPA